MFRRDFERTPQEKARRAQFSVLARLGACGYLVYIMIQLLTQPSPGSTIMTVLAVVLLVAAAVVIVITILDLIKAFKTGRFDPATYEDPEDQASLPAESDKPENGGNALDEHSKDDQADEGDGDKDEDDAE